MVDRIRYLFFDLGDTLVQGKNWVGGALNLIHDMRQRGLKLGIISNTGALTRDDLSPHLPVDFSFDSFSEKLIILSGEVGYEKPDPRIFTHAINVTESKAHFSLFVTENQEHALVAQSVGMRSARVRLGEETDLINLPIALITAELIPTLIA